MLATLRLSPSISHSRPLALSSRLSGGLGRTLATLHLSPSTSHSRPQLNLTETGKRAALKRFVQGMADLEGIVLGLVFQDIWVAVKDAEDRAEDFKPKLKDLEKTLQNLDRVVKDIKGKNIRLNESDQCEMNSMVQEGKELVSKCIGISWWDFIKKSYYQKKLVDLENKIIRFINILSTYHSQVNEQESIQNESVDFSSSHLSDPRPFEPPQVPRAPTIGIFGLIFLLFLPSEPKILKVIAIIFIIYQGIMSMLEKSESSGIWMVIKDVGKLKTTKEQLDTTISLVHVLEEIQSNSKQLLMNETDRNEDSKSLISLMEEGRKLTCESPYDIVWWNFVKKWQYQKRMAELDNKLLRISSPYLQAPLAKNIEVIGPSSSDVKPTTPQPSLKIDTSLTSPPKPEVLSSDRGKGVVTESSKTTEFLADADELDGDELSSDRGKGVVTESSKTTEFLADADELDGDEFLSSHQTQPSMRKEQIQRNLMMNLMMTNSYSLERMMKALKQQVSATTQQLEATTQLVNQQAEMMKQMQDPTKGQIGKQQG